ncbi:MAG: preprotein translocase subunit SecE [Acidiferrobacterales bacterium]|nr:preprotein translocase subunit SecE [Acidiferrobacterales bacterium]
MIDKVKIGASVLILFAGIYLYYQLPTIMGPDVSILIRVGIILLAIVIALVVAGTSQYGMNLIEFAKGSRTELRKMVWPTRPETIQMTIVVLVAVFLVGLFLWMVDWGVFKVIYDLLLGVDS